MPFDETDVLTRAVELCEDGHFAEASDLLRPVAERELGKLGVWRLLAQAELAAERYKQALQAAEHTQDLAPGEALSDVIASVALLRLGRKEDALDCARRAVDTDPVRWHEWRSTGAERSEGDCRSCAEPVCVA